MKKLDKVDWLIFISAIIGIAIINLIGKGTLYFESPDGNLYFSIAKNFVQTGHFIQTAREYEVGFVVPFGLPLIYTILYIIFHGIYGILFVQYIVYGLMFVLIRKVAKYLFRVPYMDIFLVCVIFLNDSFRLYINPAYLLTEIWSTFLIILWIFLYVCTGNDIQRNTKMLICSSMLICIRPAFALFFVVTLIMCIFQMIKSKRLHKKYFYVLGIFLVVCILNMFVNYRETGTVVLFENYSGLAFYQANNTNTKTSGYISDVANDFVEERFWAIENNESLTRGEKSKIMSAWAQEYIFSNIKKVLNNTYVKFVSLFVAYYRWDIYIMIIALIIMPIEHKKKGIIIAATILAEAIFTSMGLLIYRYSTFIIPIYVLYKVWLMDILIELVRTKLIYKNRI